MIHNSSQKRIMTYHTVISYACCLPPTVVATGITLIQLIAIVFVPAHVQNGYTKWSQTCRHGQKLITWQGPQVGKCFSEYYFLTGSSSRHDELNQSTYINTYEGSFSCSFFNKFQAVFPTRVTNKLFRQ